MEVQVLKHPTEEDWVEVKRRALVTIGKQPLTSPDLEWKQKMLNCRHSPIRYLQFSFYITDVPYWLSTELSRHHIGVEKYIRSQRTDRNTDPTPREDKPQGAPVNMIMDFNGESVLTVMNKRLCGAATKEMQNLMIMIRKEIIKTNPEYEKFLVPMCVYNGNQCHEFITCRLGALYFKAAENGASN